MKTVGELKKFLEDINDETLLVSHAHNFELHGSIIEGMSPRIVKLKVEKQQFYDVFDYEPYERDVYIYTEDGVECLLIS